MSNFCDLIFFVNGRKIVEKNPDPEETLLEYLRKKLCLTGTKLGCGEGGCGACTVMVSRYDPQRKKILHYSVNACLAPICSMHGLAVTTVEGIGSIKNGLHPVQERLAKSHGSQCGFCTPGIVMSMYTLLRNNPLPCTEEMERAFEGNLCRCTGYRPILDGFRTFTKASCPMGAQCCKNQKQNGVMNGAINGIGENQTSSHLCDPNDCKPYNATQEPIFPSELQLNDVYATQSLKYAGQRVVWYRPTKLQELLELKAQNPNCRLVIGNTEIGIEVRFKNMLYPVLVDVSHIPDLLTVEQSDAGFRFGASVTLSRIEEVLTKSIQNIDEYKTRSFKAITEMLRWFAGYQIRNVAAIGGNIMTASPISDLNPLLMAAGASLTVASKDGIRVIEMDETFFTGYRRTKVNAREVVLSVFVPYTKQNEYFSGFKQAHRREDDIAIVNAGMRVLFKDDACIVQDIALAFGGMAPTTVMALKSMKVAIGKKWDESLIEEMCNSLVEDLPLSPGAPGGMVEYRRTLTLSFFFKFYVSVQITVGKNNIPASYESSASLFHREPSKGVQTFEEVSSVQSADLSLGRPITHKSAEKQVTGEAIYIDDIPLYTNELYLAFVLSTKARAKILKRDPSVALKMPGVVDYIDYQDVPASNKFGVTFPTDEEVFATNEVICQGQVIGAVVADTQWNARTAAKAVEIVYEDLEPIITIEQAIEKQSYYGSATILENGNLSEAFSSSDHILEGELHIGGQEHFYLETHATLAVPKNEDGEMEIFSSCQAPSTMQYAVAGSLGVPASRIAIRVKRLGGGFGGKETRFNMFGVPIAVAANKLKVPVRCMLDRDEDMVASGTRHPFLGKYKVGFSKEGKIVVADVQLYCNAGHSVDLSKCVLDRSLFSSNNGYHIPTYRVTGYCCKTNIASNTAFRGFGAPQGMMIGENMVSDIAVTLGMLPEKVREMNLIKEGDELVYGQIVEDCQMQRCWDECLQQSNFEKQLEEVEKFNSENRWKKRGIAALPTMYGISFTATFLNQAGALVHVYKDGSVLLTHGGVEMGQGLHTKMIQVASKALNISDSKIFISETSTSTVPNTSPTAASSSSDLNGMAIVNACTSIMKRLEPIITENPKGSWEEWIIAAYFKRISLSSTGFYSPEGIFYNPETGKGKPFCYFSFGACCSVVEIDCLTGDHKVLKTDIVMDVGTSINPAIDIGQIEGAFVQGYGLFCLEQQKVSPSGFLFTRGPGTYKIPAFGDIPVEFNVSLLKKSKNVKAVYSSKAIGEPPLFLAASVFYAIKRAIISARSEEGISGTFRIDSPATPERIRMACKDRFTDKFPLAEKGTYTPWYVDL